MTQNEQKYAAITNSYSKISDQTIASLREFVSSREDTLMPILHRVRSSVLVILALLK